MVRNVLEIMSFSKMNFIDDKTYSVRDLSRARNFYFNKINASPTYCGWLFRDTDGKLKIEDCGEPLRIKYDEIERKFGGKFQKSKFLIDSTILSKKDFEWLYKKLNRDLISEEIKDEYQMVKDSKDKKLEDKFAQKLRSKFATGTFDDKESPLKKAYEKYNLINEDIFTNIYRFSSSYTDGPGRKIVTFEDNGPNIGKLVLTGHPSSRVENIDSNDEYKIKGTGKIFDFVFIQKENADALDIPQKVFENFKFAYFDGRTTQPKESEDWSFWKERLKDGGRVPVFFHKNGNEITSFGLSNLYKFPYSRSIMQTLLKNHTSDELDLSETIFGFSKKINNEQISLKGRVQFSHAKKVCNTQALDSRYVLLGTPKASYYPIYLVQNGGEYKTLMDNNSILAGWKRYPIHRNFNHRCQGESTQTTNITPLGENSTFDLTVRFHNLKKVEIGALISAITFHNNSSQYFHSLGLAKSYGYGKVSLNVTKISNLKYSQDEYMKAFESAMNYEIFEGQIKWHESEEIKNLFTMAKPQNDRNLKYMELKPTNEFVEAKNQQEYLHRYVNLDGVTLAIPNRLCNMDDIEIYKNEVQLLKEKKEKKRLEEEQLRRRTA
jgi:CRISPR-associated protein (TIGR03986 family)